MAGLRGTRWFGRDREDDRYRRDLVIDGRSGEGPFTIRFADVRYRAVARGLLGQVLSQSTAFQRS